MSKREVIENSHLLLSLAKEITKQDAPTKLIESFETAFTSMLTEEWMSVANKGTKVAMRTYGRKGKKKSSIKPIEASLNKVMKGFGRGVAKDINKSIALFYREVTRRFIKDFSLKVEKAVREAGLGVSFNQADKDAISVIQKLGVQTAGSYYPVSVQSKTSQVIEQVILNEGLTIEQAAVRLEAELAAALGTEVSKTVPTTFATNPQAYFRVVASNASVQATNIGRVIAMQDAGVEKYAIRAIIDKRTSNICRNLNGREFAVSKTMGAVEDFINLKTLNGLKDLLPFNNEDKVPKWAGEGLGFPPFHNLCRSVVVPV